MDCRNNPRQFGTLGNQISLLAGQNRSTSVPDRMKCGFVLLNRYTRRLLPGRLSLQKQSFRQIKSIEHRLVLQAGSPRSLEALRGLVSIQPDFSTAFFFFREPCQWLRGIGVLWEEVPIRSNLPFYSRSLGTLLLLESTCQRLVALFPPCDLCSRNVKLRGHLLQRYSEIPGRFLPIEPAHRTSSACGHVKGFSSCLGLPYGPRHTSDAP